MKTNFKKILTVFLSILFWILFWQICAVIVNKTYFLPSVPETFVALWKIIKTGLLFKTALYTFLRVILGLVLGIVIGTVLAISSYKFSIIKTILFPLISVIKSTPVASFIVILWIVLSGDALPVFIAVLMVMPIIWQNLLDGFDSIDKNLIEVSSVFEFNFKMKLKYLIYPTLIRFFIPAAVTASGLAWKSEIAAEIIGYTKNSIGQHINDSNYFYDTPGVFAWTLVVILMSILLELLTRFILKRCKNELKT